MEVQTLIYYWSRDGLAQHRNANAGTYYPPYNREDAAETARQPVGELDYGFGRWCYRYDFAAAQRPMITASVARSADSHPGAEEDHEKEVG